MKLRDNKGSITIFVLVGLLFMSAFLLLSYGSNVNKSKTAKEMFNMISNIYSYKDGDENAYMRAYTALRKQNAQEMLSSSENSSSLELTKTFYGPISNYTIYGNSVQDTATNGNPSPENPVEIQSVGDLVTDTADANYGKYRIPVKVSGKNLFKVGEISDYYNNTSNFTISGNTIIGKNVAYSSAFMTNNTYYECNNGDSYTFSFMADVGTNRTYVALYDKDKNNISSTISISGFTYNQYYGDGALFKAGQSITINITDENIKYLRFGLATFDSNLETNIPITVTNIQLEKGNSRTEYEPYVEPQTVNIYLDEPLRKVGDKGDYIDFSTGKVVRYVEERTFTGNESVWARWSASITDNSMGVYFYNYDELGAYGSPIFVGYIGMSTHFVNGGSGLATADDSLLGKMFMPSSSNPPYFGFKVPYTELTNWKSFLNNEYTSGNPLRVYYQLLTPDDSQTIEIPELKSYEDYTKIEVLTEIAPSKIEVTYDGYTFEK